MSAALAVLFWTIIGGAVALLLLAAIGTALVFREWHRDGGHW